MTCTTDEEAKESYGESWTEMKNRLDEKNRKWRKQMEEKLEKNGEKV